MTKADYIVQADAICKASKDADTAAGSAPSDPTTATAAELPALGAYFAKATPIVANEVSKLDALAKPAADSAALTGMLAKVSDLAAQYQAAGDAATSGDLTAFQTAITTLSADGAAANTVAAGYGLKVCGT